jgi:hypothetical protein
MSTLRLCCALVLAPVLAAAQVPPRATAATGERTSEPAPASGADLHRVERGDTLWDLSARYLNSPWYWPKVWSYNPEIGNPHWIYPGHVVRLRPATAEAREGTPPAVEEEASVAPELAGLSRADMGAPQQHGADDDVTVGGPYRIGYRPHAAVQARRESFVTQGQVDESGSITAAFEDKLLLTLHDRAYARFAQGAKVQPGATYVLYRTDGAVRHPLTGELFGYQSTVLGSAKTVAVDGDVATLEITQAFDPIERGALVATWREAVVKPVRPRPNRRALSGVIVAAQQGLVSTLGEHHMVFVDRGRHDGVEEGNVFTVIRAGDPYGRDPMEPDRDDPKAAGLPIEDVGLLMVVDAQERSSAALVVRSLRELHVGDRVEMRGPPGGTAALETRRVAEPR